MITVKKSILKKVFKKRSPDVHKYDFGHLLVIGGNKLYSGSPAFAALAAYQTGVDIVTIAGTKRAMDIVAGFAPDLITYPLEGDWLAKIHLKELLELTKGKTAVVIGGGLGRKDSTLKTIREFLKRVEVPCVIDADAIHALAREIANLSSLLRKEIADLSLLLQNKPCIITPHLYEFFILSGKSIEKADLKKRLEIVRAAAKKLKTTILLKANIDIISDGKQIALNKTGNPYMTVGGTGDTLAGICGSLLAQGIEPFTAARAAAYINGRAGDIAASKLKESFMASDLIEAIPEAIK